MCEEISFCKICNSKMNKFCTNGKPKTYCSVSCQNKNRSYARYRLEKTNCLTCGKEIDLYSCIYKNGKKYFSNKIQKYCSLECAGCSRQNELHKSCSICDKVFKTKTWVDKKYCSKECLKIGRSGPRKKYNKKYRSRTISELLLDKEIEHNIIYKGKYKHNNKYDPALYLLFCKNCDCPFYGYSKIRKYCSKQCGQYSQNNIYRKQYNYNKYVKLKKNLIQLFGGKCKHCNKSYDISAFCFHHTRDKKFVLDQGAFTSKKYYQLIEEVDKCELLCHNCHAILHEKERMLRSLNKKLTFIEYKNNYKKIIRSRLNKKKLIKYKGGACESCGFRSSYIQCMSFHHIDQKTKSYELNQQNIRYKKFNQLIEELNKCQLLCMNCHISINKDREIKS